MNVVYASNEHYARHLAVSMVSLFERNQKAKKLVVYVVSMGISAKSRGLLRAMAGKYKRELYFIEVGQIRKLFDFPVDTRGFDISAMARLFVGRLLPGQVRRVLYLDCDTVVAQPLTALWNTDLHGKLLGAVLEPTIYPEAKREAGLKAQDAYVNSGVLLIDLKQWRQSRAEGRLLDFYRKKGGSLFACDQDTLNGALKGEIFYLSPRYNFFPNYRYFSYKELLWYGKAYRMVPEAEFRKAKSHPAIIHYAGDERPWIAGNRNHYRRAYEKYLAMTPWEGAPKEEGKRLYMLSYHMMDYVTVACPPVRRYISRYFGMKMVEARNGGRLQGADVCRGSHRQEKPGKPKGWDGRIQALMATYQGEAYIEGQLDSILAQTVPEIQVVVSDDGSTDRTREILERYQKEDPERVVLRHRERAGAKEGGGGIPAPARNFFWLLSQAEGEYLLLSDQDDIWHPKKVETLLKKIKEIEGEGKLPALVYSDMEVVDSRLQPISPSFFSYAHSNPRRTSFSEILVENPVTGGAMMMNRALLELAKKEPDACVMHDWWIALCASCFGAIAYVPQALSQYRQHGNNVLGAAKTGSLEDLRRRAGRQKEVEENYRKMFQQAAAFEKRFGPKLGIEQRKALWAFLALPGQGAGRRLANIAKHRLFKSSKAQTLAQCFTIPSRYQEGLTL